LREWDKNQKFEFIQLAPGAVEIDPFKISKCARKIAHSIATEILLTIQSFLRFFSNALEPAT